MNNKELLNLAIQLLNEVNSNDLETVQVNHTKYDDGSVGFTVDLTYSNIEETKPSKD
ncbi:MAG: hypothetical protein L0L07_00080 [Staphylococcus equorum]|nr:hypothetical protein [Staphylococcus equorum]